MLQTHPETLASRHNSSPAGDESRDWNATARLLMCEVQALLKQDVEHVDIARRLQSTLPELLRVLNAIRENQFESGPLSDLLHGSPRNDEQTTDRLKDFDALLETLDELAVRIDWNLPIEKIVPFADLRLARWMAKLTDAPH